MFEGKSIVIFVAHPDDIEIGMGGTLSQLKAQKPQVVVFADTVNYNGSDIRQEFYDSMTSMGIEATLHSFEADNLGKDIAEIRRLMYIYKDNDIFFSTSLRSTHQDHRLIGQAVNDIMLEKTVLFFEDIRSGQDQRVNCYNRISSAQLIDKYRMIEKYKTQKHRHYMTDDAISTMAKFRGGQIKTGYAEAFEVNRFVM